MTERKDLTDKSPWVLPRAGSKIGHFVKPKCAWRRILCRAELARLIAMIAVARKQGPAYADAALIEADKELGRIRFDAFARRMPKGTDPFALVLEQYRKQAVKLKHNPDEVWTRDLRIHYLRRTLGSWQAATGASLPVIGRSLGHNQAQTTAIYARLGLEPMRLSVERATQAMLAAGKASEPAPAPPEKSRTRKTIPRETR